MARESDYYIWLRDIVGNREGYSKLIKQLDTTPYEWIFSMDCNRAEGGIALRGVYATENSIESTDVRYGPCTVLEMLIGVSTHMSDLLGDDQETWFWQLIENLNLDKYTDDDYDARSVEFIINSWLQLKYGESGIGSLFPLKEYDGDCRNLDVWSQMNAWINENYPADDSWLN